MNAIKKAYIEALESSTDALAVVLEAGSLLESGDVLADIGENSARLKHPDFVVKTKLRTRSETLRGKARILRNADEKEFKSPWEAFTPEHAAKALDAVEALLSIAEESENAILIHAVEKALAPIRVVVEKYATLTANGLRFPEHAADKIAPFPEPPPDPNIRFK